MSMYPWPTPSQQQPQPATAAAHHTPTPAPRIHSPSSTSVSPSQSPYHMQQMRWPPSMISQPGSLPAVSSNLRLSHGSTAHGDPHSSAPPGSGPGHSHVLGNGHARAQSFGQVNPNPNPHARSQSQGQSTSNGNLNAHPVSVVIESHPQQQQQRQQQSLAPLATENIESSEESEQSDSGTGIGSGARGENGANMLNAGSQNNSITAGGSGGGNRLTSTATNTFGGATVAGEDLADEELEPSTAGLNDTTPRKHGKRLTTSEEVSLFDICNRHALEFGRRSNLCKWWMTVTMEFTADQGHPYSWHSVRRKVEVVTKRRIHFLEKQRDKGGLDNSNPRWREAVDAWIPTWQRWEEAEARRIERRDSRRPRKRKDRPAEWDELASGGTRGWRPPPPLLPQPQQNQNQNQPMSNDSAPSSFRPPSNAVQLPPGFDTMFSSLPNTPYNRQQQVDNQPSSSIGNPYAASTSNSSGAGAGTGAGGEQNNNMMTAVLETLGKLNKHLDSVNSTPNTNNQTSSSPLIASLADSSQQRSSQQDTATPIRDEATGSGARPGSGSGSGSILPSAVISQLKDELRQELRDEFEKEKASLEERLDSVQRTTDMILEMLRQEPA